VVVQSSGGIVTGLAALFALQEIDLALSRDRKELEDIESRFGETDELRDARRLVAERKQELRSAESREKDAEYEADEQRRKIEPVEERLYRGGLTNPKELEDLQAELESLQRRRETLDERALAALDEVEVAQRALDEADAILRQIAGDFDTEQEEMHERRSGLEREIAELEARRTQDSGAIDSELLTLYERIAKKRQGRGIAKVEGGACGGCHISLPMNVLQRARGSAAITQCSSCERILYVT
jgi:predicted  nucleic acid-binding Zn-ribbon protein